MRTSNRPLAVALLVGAVLHSVPARAQLDPGRTELEQEERTAYQRCVEKWRELQPRAEEELRRPEPAQFLLPARAMGSRSDQVYSQSGRRPPTKTPT